jgi:hypothetical protein
VENDALVESVTLAANAKVVFCVIIPVMTPVVGSRVKLGGKFSAEFDLKVAFHV